MLHFSQIKVVFSIKKDQNYIKKLFQTYSATLLLILTVFFAISLLILYREQYRRNIQIQSQLSLKVQEQTEASLKEMDRIINGLLFDKSFMKIMKSSDTSADLMNDSDQVVEKFVALDAPLFSTYRIIAFNDSSYYTLAKTGENPDLIKTAALSYPWKEEVLSANGKKVFIPPHRDTFDGEHQLVYSVARTITDGKQNYGFIEVQNLYSQLENYCKLTEASGSVLILSQEGTFIYPAVSGEADSKLADMYETICSTGAQSGSLRFGQKQISYHISKYSGWITAVYCPVSEFVPYGLEIIVLTGSIFLLLAMLSLLTIRIVTRRLAAPLTDLSEAIGRVSFDNMNVTLNTTSNIVEINKINQAFRTMFDQLKEAIARNIQSCANEERAAYLALQAQMNPHTLYNTISMIESVSYMNGDKEVSNLCICFSQMLRYISDYSKREYTIQDELSHLNNYISLIEKRHEGKLNICIHAQPSLLSVVLPKFTIQPLVENAVKHGFSSQVHELNIEVIIEPVSNGWHLVVRDNGSGFSNDAITMIYSQLQESDATLVDHGDVVNTKIGNLGLTNIYIRFRILYGDSFSIDIGNNPNSPGGYIELTVITEV